MSPNPPPWREAFRHGWIFGLMGGLLLLSGTAMLVLFGLAGVGTPHGDLALDERSALAEGEVLQTEKVGERLYRVQFVFRDGAGAEYRAFCYSETPPPPGKQVVEYLPADPAVARLRGARRRVTGLWQRVAIGALFLPGLALLGLWLRAAVRARVRATETATEAAEP